MFDPTIPTVNIIKEHWPTITSSQDTRQKLPPAPRISYRAPTNIATILTRARTNANLETPADATRPIVPVPQKFPAKLIKCRTTNCSTCHILTNRRNFICYQTKHRYEIRETYSCDTNNAIYILECSICNKQYVGETGTSIRVRMRHHRNMNNSNTDRPIYRHTKLHHGDFNIYKLIIIEQVTDKTNRKIKESQWIKELRTKLPFGLNVIQKPTINNSNTRKPSRTSQDHQRTTWTVI